MKKIFNLLMAGALVALVACNPTDKNGVDDATEGGNAEFKISVTGIDATSATVAVSPSNDSIYYYFDVVDEASLLEYESKEAFCQAYIEYLADYYSSYYGYDYASLVAGGLFSQGVDKYEFDDVLDPSTKYYAVAFQLDEAEAKVIGSVAYKEFTTDELAKSTNVISIELKNDSIFVSTTNDDDYFLSYIDKDTLATYYEGDAAACFADDVDYYYSNYGSYFSYFLYSGDIAFSVKDNFVKGESGTYVFMAAAMHNAYINSEVFTQEIVITEDMCGEEEAEDGGDDATDGDAAGDDSSDTKAVRKHIAPASLAKPHFNGAFRALK